MSWLHGRGAVSERVLSALSWWTSRGKWEAACLHKRVLSHADVNPSRSSEVKCLWRE